MSEESFSRETLLKKQKYFQSVKKYTHLRMPTDRITSVAIPLAFAATCSVLIVRGIYNMSLGIGKKE